MIRREDEIHFTCDCFLVRISIELEFDFSSGKNEVIHNTTYPLPYLPTFSSCNVRHDPLSSANILVNTLSILKVFIFLRYNSNARIVGYLIEKKQCKLQWHISTFLTCLKEKMFSAIQILVYFVRKLEGKKCTFYNNNLAFYIWWCHSFFLWRRRPHISR